MGPRGWWVVLLLGGAGCPRATDTTTPPLHTGTPPTETALPTGDTGTPTEEPWLTVSVPDPGGIRDLVARATPLRADPMDVAWSWTVDGAASPVAGDTVPAHALVVGQVWTATATPTVDGVVGPPASASYEVPPPPGGNVLVVIMDDLGLDRFNASGIGTPQRTPVMDSLVADGMYFRNAYVNPLCSPTRSALLTGRLPERTGVGDLIGGGTDEELSLDAITVPEALVYARAGLYSSSAVGKYHLASGQSQSSWSAPNLQGFGWYSGSNDNLTNENNYFSWYKVTNGVRQHTTKYATTDTVDDAIQQVQAMPEPWFLHLAFNAPHDPWHVPPADLTTVDVPDTSPTAVLYGADLEAADTELGRFFDTIDPGVLARTTIVLLGDNGTPQPAVLPPFDPQRSKHAVYEGGTHVPLVVAGPLVAQPGSSSDALVHVVDLMATVADIAGVPLTGAPDHLALDLGEDFTRVIDGQSLLPYLEDPTTPGLRDHVVVHDFAPNGPEPHVLRDNVTLVEHRWKLMRSRSLTGVWTDEFFDMDTSDYDEGQDLLPGGLNAEQNAAYQRLSAQLDADLAALPYDGY